MGSSNRVKRAAGRKDMTDAKIQYLIDCLRVSSHFGTSTVYFNGREWTMRELRKLSKPLRPIAYL